MATELQAFLESWHQEQKVRRIPQISLRTTVILKSVQGLFQTDDNPVWTQNICSVFFYAQNQSLIQWSHGSVLCTCLQTCHIAITWRSHDYYNTSDWSYQKCHEWQQQKVENLWTRFCHAASHRAALGLNGRIDFRVINFFGCIAPRRAMLGLNAA